VRERERMRQWQLLSIKSTLQTTASPSNHWQVFVTFYDINFALEILIFLGNVVMVTCAVRHPIRWQRRRGNKTDQLGYRENDYGNE
jgi:hypothetical protein